MHVNFRSLSCCPYPASAGTIVAERFFHERLDNFYYYAICKQRLFPKQALKNREFGMIMRLIMQKKRLVISISLLIFSGCAKFTSNQETYLFVNNIDSFYSEYQCGDISCSLSIKKSRSYDYKIIVKNEQGTVSDLYGNFKLVNRNDGSCFFVSDALTRSDSGKEMRYAQVLLIKCDGDFYYLIAISIQRKNTLYSVNIISPVSGVENVINPLNSTNEFSEKVKIFIKKSTCLQ